MHTNNWKHCCTMYVFILSYEWLRRCGHHFLLWIPKVIVWFFAPCSLEIPSMIIVDLWEVSFYCILAQNVASHFSEQLCKMFEISCQTYRSNDKGPDKDLRSHMHSRPLWNMIGHFNVWNATLKDDGWLASEMNGRPPEFWNLYWLHLYLETCFSTFNKFCTYRLKCLEDIWVTH